MNMSAFPLRARQFDLWQLVLISLVGGLLAMGAHDLAISRLGVPYPREQNLPLVVRALALGVRIAALVELARCASGALSRLPVATRVLLFGFLVLCLDETIRVAVINNVVTEAWTRGHRVWLFTQIFPSVVSTFYQGALAALIVLLRGGRRGWMWIVATAVAAAAYIFAIQPVIDAGMQALQSAYHDADAPSLYNPPYTWHVYKYIYIGFIESIAACVALAALAWPGLKGGGLRRVATFTVLILLAHGRVIATFVYCFWVKYPLPVAVAAEGQFFAETLILAASTGLAWHLFWRKRQGGASRSMQWS